MEVDGPMQQRTQQLRQRRNGHQLRGAVAAASLFAAACAGGQGGTGDVSEAAGSQSGAAEEAQFDNLTVGAMVGLTGEFSAFGEDTQRAFEMAAEDIR